MEANTELCRALVRAVESLLATGAVSLETAPMADAKRYRVHARPPKGRDGPNWQLVIRDPEGKIRQRSARTSDGEEARKRAKEEEARLNGDAGLARLRPGLSMREIMDLYADHREATGTKPNTVDKIRIAAVSYGSRVQVVTRAGLVAARDELARKGLSGGTINGYVVQARLAWEWAEERELVVGEFPRPRRGLRRKRTKKRPYRPGESEAVLAILRDRWPWAYPVALILHETGSRITETLHLRGRDVDRRRGMLLLTVTKTDEPRWVPVSPAVLALLPDVGPEAYLFRAPKGASPPNRRSFYNAASKALQLAGLGGEDLDPAHSFRRSKVRDNLAAGLPLPVSMRLLGHATPGQHLEYQRRAEVGLEQLAQAASLVMAYREEMGLTGEGGAGPSAVQGVTLPPVSPNPSTWRALWIGPCAFGFSGPIRFALDVLELDSLLASTPRARARLERIAEECAVGP